jgi:hypothetical protein
MTAMNENTVEYVTAMIGGQLFGLPISRVQDVFAPERLTRVPLAGLDIAGLLNLRGRIVTVIDMRCRLDLEAQERVGRQMAVGVEHRRASRPRVGRRAPARRQASGHSGRRACARCRRHRGGCVSSAAKRNLKCKPSAGWPARNKRGCNEDLSGS